ncbi:MAG: conjugal transfer protein TraX [Clostridia bacterium]|nr:conjugal transfer protein TraX [Clostridia bacterium]
MEKAINKQKGLNSNALKLIAIAAMTVDHFTWAVFPGTQKVWYVIALHIIGRITAPVMWFFIAEGCRKTHDIKKYALRMLIFAAVSHFAYCFAFGIPLSVTHGGFFNRTSVMWALMLAVVLAGINQSEKIKEWQKTAAMFAFCVLAFPADWSSIAVMAPLFIYFHNGDKKKQMADIVIWTAVYALVYFLFLDRVYGILQMFTFLSIPLLMLYNGERGKAKGMKWLFYVYYPAHLVVVGIVRLALHGNISAIF